MNRLKRFALMAFVLISVVGFAFAQAQNEASDTVTINFWHHYSAQSAENKTLTEVLIPEFERQNPGLGVGVESQCIVMSVHKTSGHCAV
mgnify:CR=1 FL=1